ncbi:hypothetical protein [Blastococcus brunescens]|uniref:DUF998 domain-containing protein n=1 Tax=Blastococcus brunescens TaxID=1564165 RepID=A0ABZ1B4Y8_9ACTN|nr:hypothetical protein [Blastococcus sp. BMG 8361]WRL65880.1 hypothetical protein U6N30_10165 [Blastococcus sp. BMG 8361]
MQRERGPGTLDGPGQGTPRGIRRLLGALLIASVGLTLLSLALPNITDWPVLADPGSPGRRLVEVAGEQNLPTWFCVVVLALAASAHLFTAFAARREKLADWRLWVVSALVIAGLSLDDAASLHEQLEGIGRAAGAGSFPFAWVVPGAVLGLVVVLALGRLALRLRGTSRRYLTVGLALFLGAALGIEALNGAILAAQGPSRWYVVMTHLEELTEMVGAVLLLGSALTALAIRTTPDGGWLVRYGAVPVV